jgi:hypothetical protein
MTHPSNAAPRKRNTPFRHASAKRGPQASVHDPVFDRNKPISIEIPHPDVKGDSSMVLLG